MLHIFLYACWPSVCLFVLSMVSFAVQKPLSLIRSHLFIFASISFTLGDKYKKYCYTLCQGMFMISSLTFRSLIHFELTFVYGVRKCSNFILLHVAVQFSQCHLLKRLSLLHCMYLPPLSQINWPKMHGFISGLFILFHWSMSVFVPVPYCLYYWSFVV